MIGGLLLAVGLLGTGPDEGASTKPEDRAAYEAARLATGLDAPAQVRLALWCEAHGMTAERMKHLAAAVVDDPSSALARGLMGLVARDGKWERPEDVAREVKDDDRLRALMQEYLDRRARAGDRADDQWKLALWCEQSGLKDQAAAHLRAVLRLDPRRDAAWKRLGFKKVCGRWIKPEWQAAARREADDQERANKHWKPILERLRSGLSGRDRQRRAADEVALSQITDPRAVPMVWAVFVSHGAEGQRLAVRVLAQIDSPGSSRALALLAFSSRSGEARGQAMQILRLRDPRDFAPVLVGMIRDPIKYDVRPVNGPGKTGELVIQDGTTRRKRLYTPLSEPNVPLGPDDQIVVDPNTGLPVISRLLAVSPGGGSMAISTPGRMMALMGITPPAGAGQIAGVLHQGGLSASQSQKLGQQIQANAMSSYQVQASLAAVMLGGGGRYRLAPAEYLQIPVGQMEVDALRSAEVARQQLAGDVRAIDSYNAPILETNRRVRQILSETAGLDHGDDRKAWAKWVVDLFGYALAPQKASAEETTVIEQVPLSYQPQAVPVLQAGAALVRSHSCFGGGTPVRALDGPRPIESLRAGDLVLTQDPGSGELKYRAIVEVYHNPPNATFRVALDSGESIVATGIHRLWRAGKGWSMVRELRPGDVLRTLGGVSTVKSVEADRTRPVYNLRVAEGESYFVGDSGVLAHDNSTINPVPEPFDAVGALPTASASQKPRPRSMLGR